VLREPRFLLAAIVPLVLAAAQTLVHEAPPADFFVAGRHPGEGVLALLLLLAGVLLFVRALRNLELAVSDDRSPGYQRVVADLARMASDAVGPLAWAAAVVALYALSLAVLELFEELAPGGIDTAFQRGHTAVSACWGLVGLGLLYAGLVRRSRPLRVGGFALFGISLAKIFLYDLAALSSVARAVSFLAVGAVLLAAGFLYQRLAADLGSGAGGHGNAA
jgi:uncharacterized membrane protein